MDIWVVGRFATIFSKAKWAYVGFVWVFMIDSFVKKNWEKVGGKRVEPLVQFRN